MTPEAKKKYAMILGIIVLVVGAAAGIFRAVGCEKGAEITDTIGDMVDVVTPSDEESVVEDDTEVVEEVAVVEAPSDVLTMANEKCGEITFPASLLPGDKGPQVRALQEWLQCSGEEIDADGSYGKGTAEAVARQLPAD
jgi:hypothetical protein